MGTKYIKMFFKKKWVLSFLSLSVLALIAQEAVAAGTLGDMAKSVTDTFKDIGNLITAGSYIAGLGFAIGAILKFKAHKDNPTQITVGTPIALVFIAAALLFLPSILSVTGKTMFGGEAKTAGPSGEEFKPGS